MIPGVCTQPVTDPQEAREIALAAISDRRFCLAAMTFFRAIRFHDRANSVLPETR